MKEPIWIRERVPSGFWKNPENRRWYMQWLGEQLGYKTPEDWYKITQKDFKKNKGYGLLDYYQSSPSTSVIDCFPEYEWKEWLFGVAPNSFWNKSDNRYRYMTWLGEMLGFTKPEDWYKITQKDFYRNKGCGFLHYYQGCPSAAVMDYLPEYDWKEWCFDKVPQNFWKKAENCRRYIQWLGEKLGYKVPEDWYKITQKDFYRNKGSRFLSHYQNSPSTAVMTYFSEYEWKEWLFATAPINFWKNPENRRQYMQWLGEQLGYKTPEDWYKITQKDFCRNKGRGGFLHYYQGSPSAAVMEYFPEYEWKEWLFVQVPKDFWDKSKNRRQFMEWLGEKLGYKTPEDWYKITKNDFASNKGGGVLKSFYQNSPSIAVMTCFPNYEWKEWLFSYAPFNFWQNLENRRQYMQWLGERLGYKMPEDWYKITVKDFYSNRGSGLLGHYYQGSPALAVKEYLPDYEWKEWFFDSHVPNSFWDNSENRRRYMHWLGEQLGYRKPDDWYKITGKDIRKNKGRGFFEYFQCSPSAAVMAYLPEYDWQPEKFSVRRKRQKQLYQIVKRIFPEYEVKWEFRHSKMRYVKTYYPMELDIFVPSLHLAFEYQGEQHVLPISIWGGIPALKDTQRRDEEKREACKKHGITLIEVPHSWDGQEDTAIEMLSRQFVKKVKDRINDTEQIQAALKAINTYCKKKQLKKRKKRSGNHQVNFDFNTR